MIVWPLRSPDCQFKAAHPEGGGLKFLINDSQNGLQHLTLLAREVAGQDVLYVLPLFFLDTHVARGDSNLWAMTVLLRPKQIPPPIPFKPFWLHLQVDSWTMYVRQGMWQSLPEPIPPDWVNRFSFPVKSLNLNLARSLPYDWEALTNQPEDLQNPSPPTAAVYNHSSFPRVQNELELFTQKRDAFDAAFRQNLENCSWSWTSLGRLAISLVGYQGFDTLVGNEKKGWIAKKIWVY